MWPMQLLANNCGGTAAESDKQYLSDKIRTCRHIRESILYRVAQKERMFLKWVVVRKVKVGDLPTPPENSAMQQWNVEHRVFAVEHFFRNNDSVDTVQHLFHRQFNFARDVAIPDRNTVLRWGESFRTTGSFMKRMSTGRLRTARTPENESVRRSVIVSPRGSARRHASILGLSRHSLQHILHGELNFHPYKIMIVQKLFPSDFVQHRLFCERMLEIIASDDVILMMSGEAHFHLDGYVNKQNC